MACPAVWSGRCECCTNAAHTHTHMCTCAHTEYNTHTHTHTDKHTTHTQSHAHTHNKFSLNILRPVLAFPAKQILVYATYVRSRQHMQCPRKGRVEITGYPPGCECQLTRPTIGRGGAGSRNGLEGRSRTVVCLPCRRRWLPRPGFDKGQEGGSDPLRFRRRRGPK